MSRELASAYLSDHGSKAAATTARLTAFVASTGMSYQRVDFTAFVHRRTERDAKESDQSEVGYLVVKDPTDPEWKDAADMKEWREFMAKYIPDGDTTDVNYVYAYSVAALMHQVLKQCGTDFSRENIMKQASNIQPTTLPLLLPGMQAATTPTDFRPLKQLQLMRWKTNTWERFGEIIGA